MGACPGRRPASPGAADVGAGGRGRGCRALTGRVPGTRTDTPAMRSRVPARPARAAGLGFADPGGRARSVSRTSRTPLSAGGGSARGTPPTSGSEGTGGRDGRDLGAGASPCGAAGPLRAGGASRRRRAGPALRGRARRRGACLFWARRGAAPGTGGPPVAGRPARVRYAGCGWAGPRRRRGTAR
jgi:hypothetical protein